MSLRPALVQAVIISRLDYYNSLLYGASGKDLNCLQKLQNSAARFVSGAARRDHIIPVLERLHWLPLKQRVEYKVTILVHKALSTVVPSYMCELLSPYVPLRQLHTADMSLLSVPRTASSIGDRVFSVVGPRLFNSLPDLKNANDISAFRKKLKTYLFQEVCQTS